MPKLTFDNVSQLAIMVMGASSVFLLGQQNKYGPIVGLAAQPFWFYTTIKHKQWGILIACVFYTTAYIAGIQNFWFSHRP
ncbi:MAG: hypothetical protein WCT32_02780 [Patescibacteria group bacterium]